MEAALGRFRTWISGPCSRKCARCWRAPPTAVRSVTGSVGGRASNRWLGWRCQPVGVPIWSRSSAERSWRRAWAAAAVVDWSRAPSTSSLRPAAKVVSAAPRSCEPSAVSARSEDLRSAGLVWRTIHPWFSRRSAPLLVAPTPMANSAARSATRAPGCSRRNRRNSNCDVTIPCRSRRRSLSALYRRVSQRTRSAKNPWRSATPSDLYATAYSVVEGTSTGENR